MVNEKSVSKINIEQLYTWLVERLFHSICHDTSPTCFDIICEIIPISCSSMVTIPSVYVHYSSLIAKIKPLISFTLESRSLPMSFHQQYNNISIDFRI